jgi:C4-dicarboxylate transporter, DctQ subunit
LRLLNKVTSIWNRVLGSLMFLACTIFAFAMLLVCIDVILRYAFDSPISWALEICEYILVGIVSLGMAWLLKEEGHAKVDLVLHQLSPRAQGLVDGVTSVLGTAAVAVIVIYAIKETVSFIGTPAAITGILHVQKVHLLIPLVAGLFLLLIELSRRSYRSFRKWKVNEEN